MGVQPVCRVHAEGSDVEQLLREKSCVCGMRDRQDRILLYTLVGGRNPEL